MIISAIQNNPSGFYQQALELDLILAFSNLKLVLISINKSKL